MPLHSALTIDATQFNQLNNVQLIKLDRKCVTKNIRTEQLA